MKLNMLLFPSFFSGNSRIFGTSAIELPPKARVLIDLPREFTTLLDKAAAFKCPNSHNGHCQNPAICLVCGIMLCSRVREIIDVIWELALAYTYRTIFFFAEFDIPLILPALHIERLQSL